MVKFNRITNATTHASDTADVVVNSRYPDRFLGSATTSTVSGLPSQSALLYKFPIAGRPGFGDAELVGLKSHLYVNSITAPTTFTPPQITHYKMKKNDSITAANMTIANENVVFFASQHNSLEEEVDDIAESFSNVNQDQSVITVAATKILYEGAYFEPEEAFYAFNFGQAGPSVQNFIERYGETFTLPNSGGMTKSIIPVKRKAAWKSPYKGRLTRDGNFFARNHIWEPQKGKKWSDPWEPEWSKDFGDAAVKYKVSVPITDKVEDAPIASSVGSLITDFHMGPKIYNKEGEVVVKSDITVSSDKARTDGAALKLSSKWQGSVNTALAYSATPDFYRDINIHGTFNRGKWGFAGHFTDQDWPVMQNSWVAVEVPRPAPGDVGGAEFNSQISPEIYVDFNVEAMTASTDGPATLGDGEAQFVPEGTEFVRGGPIEIEIVNGGSGYFVDDGGDARITLVNESSQDCAYIYVTEIDGKDNSTGGNFVKSGNGVGRISKFKWAAADTAAPFIADDSAYSGWSGQACFPGKILTAKTNSGRTSSGETDAKFRIVREQTGGSMVGGTNPNRCFAITFADRLPGTNEDLVQFAFNEMIYKPAKLNTYDNFMGLLCWNQKEVVRRTDGGTTKAGYMARGTEEVLRISPLTRSPQYQFFSSIARTAGNVVTLSMSYQEEPHGFKVGDRINVVCKNENDDDLENSCDGATISAVTVVPHADGNTISYDEDTAGTGRPDASDSTTIGSQDTDYHGYVTFHGDTPNRADNRIEGQHFMPDLGFESDYYTQEGALTETAGALNVPRGHSPTGSQYEGLTRRNGVLDADGLNLNFGVGSCTPYTGYSPFDHGGDCGYGHEAWGKENATYDDTVSVMNINEVADYNGTVTDTVKIKTAATTNSASNHGWATNDWLKIRGNSTITGVWKMTSVDPDELYIGKLENGGGLDYVSNQQSSTWIENISKSVSSRTSWFTRGSLKDGYRHMSLTEQDYQFSKVPYKMENLRLNKDSWYRARFVIDPAKDGCKVAIQNLQNHEDLKFEEHLTDPFIFNYSSGTYDYIGNVKNGTGPAPWNTNGTPKYMIIWTNNFFVNSSDSRHFGAAGDAGTVPLPQRTGWDCQYDTDVDSEVTVHLDRIGFKNFYPVNSNLSILKDNTNYSGYREKIEARSVPSIHNKEGRFNPTIYSIGVDEVTDIFSDTNHWLMLHGFDVAGTADATAIDMTSIATQGVAQICSVDLTAASDGDGDDKEGILGGDYIVLYDGDNQPVCFWFVRHDNYLSDAFAPPNVETEPQNMVKVDIADSPTHTAAEMTTNLAAAIAAHDSFASASVASSYLITVTNAKKGYANVPINGVTRSGTGNVTLAVDTAGKGCNFAAGYIRGGRIAKESANTHAGYMGTYEYEDTNFSGSPLAGGKSLFEENSTSTAGKYGLQINDDASVSGNTKGFVVAKETDVVNLVDDFATKGTLEIKIDGTTSSPFAGTSSLDVQKRENYYASTKVTRIVDAQSGKLEVANPEVLRCSADTTYILYQRGQDWATTTGGGVATYVEGDKRLTGLSIVGDTTTNIIQVNKNLVPYTLPDKFLHSSLIDDLFICAEKYWFLMMINPRNASGDALPARAYYSADILSAVVPTSTGTTYNEFQYRTDDYNNKWAIDTTDSSGVLDIDKDYGFGAYEKEDTSGGHIIDKPIDTTGYNIFDLSGVLKAEEHEPGDVLAFYAAPKEPTSDYACVLASDDASSNKPIYQSIFEDTLPERPSLKVGPNKDDPFYPEFTWGVSGSDLWYGFFIVSDITIPNQYHDAIIHFPLNEVGTHGTAASAPTEKIQDATTNVTISGALYDLEGLAGHSLRFDGSDDYVAFGTSGSTDPTITCTTEMSIVAHIIPDADIAAHNNYVVSQLISGGEKFAIYVNASKQVVADVYWSDSGKVQLTSSSIITADGETPTNIILTVDTTLKSGNVKLYINGRLEDMTGQALETGTVNNWDLSSGIGAVLNTQGSLASQLFVIGSLITSGTSSSLSFDGKIEEVVVYKKCIYPVVPQDESFIFTKPVSEQNATSLASAKSYNTKLFIKDYHNIRGKTREEVTSSSPVSWRKASFPLDAT